MKNLLLIVIILSSTLAMAQVRVGLVGGGQLTRLPYKTPYSTFNGPDAIGFHAGSIADIALSPHWSIRPQFIYSRKGGQYTLNGNPEVGPIVERSRKINYLEIPLQLAYSLKAGPGRVLVGVGAYIGYALNGKDNIILDGQVSPTDIEFGSVSYRTKRLDYGFRVSAGYELTSGLGLSFFYAPGLSTIENGTAGTAKNNAFGLSLSYLFGK